MNQHSIDLLPDDVRAQSQAGVVVGRYIGVAVAVALLLTVAGIHSKVRLNHARGQLDEAERQAALVIGAEAQAGSLRAQLHETRLFIQQYERTALPLKMSQILATVVNELPLSVTLDRIDLVVGVKRSARSARSRGAGKPKAHQARMLTGELRGVAATDDDVAEIVARMEAHALIEHVSLDFSRSRAVRGRGAREFRISFGIDLDIPYRVVEASQAVGPGEVVDAVH